MRLRLHLHEWRYPASLAGCLLVMHTFFLPLSTTITNSLFYAFFALWCIDKNAKERWKYYFHYPLTAPILALVALSALGLIYTSADWQAGVKTLSQVSRLCIIPILAYYLDLNPQIKKKILIIFMLAMTLTVIASMIKAYTGISIGHRTYENNVFKNHIVISYFIAMSIFVGCVWLDKIQTMRKLLLLVLGLFLFYMAFLNTGRIGYIILYIALAVYINHYYRLKGLLIFNILFAGSSVFLYSVSGTFSTRMDVGLQELTNYFQGNAISPVGSRIDFLLNGIKLCWQHPIFGTGTGSFCEIYSLFFSQSQTVLTDNPHNQYILFAVELGGLGLAAFLWLFAKQWKIIKLLKEENKLLAQGVFFTFMIGCVLNSWIKNFTECHFYCLMTAYFIPGLFLHSASQQEDTHLDLNNYNRPLNDSNL